MQNILNKNSTHSRLIKNDDILSIKELAQYSTIPSFLTNLTIKSNGIENCINLPILDENATLEFYAVVKNNKQEHLNLIK